MENDRKSKRRNEVAAYAAWTISIKALNHVNALKRSKRLDPRLAERLHDIAVEAEQDAYQRWTAACNDLDADELRNDAANGL